MFLTCLCSQVLAKAQAHKDALFQALVALEYRLVMARRQRELRTRELQMSKQQHEKLIQTLQVCMVYVCMYVCMYVCVCVYVCMYVCMCVCRMSKQQHEKLIQTLQVCRVYLSIDETM